MNDTANSSGDTWSSEPISTLLIKAIAEHEGVDPTDLEVRLHDAIDTDALDLLDSHSGSEWQIRFTVGGHVVTVDHERTISVDDG
jgi:hypothetical protein